MPTKKKKSAASHRIPRLPIALVLFTALLLGGLFCIDLWQRAQDTQRHAAQQRDFALIDANIRTLLQQKLDKAQSRERQAATQLQQFVAHDPVPTETPCDISSPATLTVVVNKKHCIEPQSWTPQNLTLVEGFFVRQEMAGQLTSLLSTIRSTGATISLTSAFRSYDNQIATYNEGVNITGTTALADSTRARPGYSEHQTGLAIDVKAGNCALECFASTPAYTWLQAHAAEYGFIERYQQGMTPITGYSPEPWHWRYVGRTVALDMKAKNLKTLEAYYDITGGDYS
ncbi:M15 family metallopeptidase [Candidatus Saccharibacteria bacterium]|nr:MAG: M15 family metallopeptidase [Candidatus Saccharibacteria bacterium]